MESEQKREAAGEPIGGACRTCPIVMQHYYSALAELEKLRRLHRLLGQEAMRRILMQDGLYRIRRRTIEKSLERDFPELRRRVVLELQPHLVAAMPSAIALALEEVTVCFDDVLDLVDEGLLHFSRRALPPISRDRIPLELEHATAFGDVLKLTRDRRRKSFMLMLNAQCHGRVVAASEGEGGPYGLVIPAKTDVLVNVPLMPGPGMGGVNVQQPK